MLMIKNAALVVGSQLRSKYNTKQKIISSKGKIVENKRNSGKKNILR